MTGALEEEVESAEAAEVTAADFAVMLDGVPGARCVKPEDHASFVRDPCAHALTHTSRCVGYPGLLSLRSRCSNTCSYAS